MIIHQGLLLEEKRVTYTEIEKIKDILLSHINYLNLLQKKKLTKRFSIKRIIVIASCLLVPQDNFFTKIYSMAENNLTIINSIITNVERIEIL